MNVVWIATNDELEGTGRIDPVYFVSEIPGGDAGRSTFDWCQT